MPTDVGCTDGRQNGDETGDILWINISRRDRALGNETLDESSRRDRA
jgi:hypothetical protein